MAGAEQENSRKRNPPPHRMHNDRPGKIMKFCTVACFQPSLNTEGVVPGNAFKEGIDKADQHKSCNQLRMKFGTFSDTARNNGGNGGGKGQ